LETNSPALATADALCACFRENERCRQAGAGNAVVGCQSRSKQSENNSTAAADSVRAGLASCLISLIEDRCTTVPSLSPLLPLRQANSGIGGSSGDRRSESNRRTPPLRSRAQPSPSPALAPTTRSSILLFHLSLRCFLRHLFIVILGHPRFGLEKPLPSVHLSPSPQSIPDGVYSALAPSPSPFPNAGIFFAAPAHTCLSPTHRTALFFGPTPTKTRRQTVPPTPGGRNE